MKFKIDSREQGNEIREQIFLMEDECTHITLEGVRRLLGLDNEAVEIDDDHEYKTQSWEIAKLHGKIRTRFHRKDKQWYLYMPEPEEATISLRFEEGFEIHDSKPEIDAVNHELIDYFVDKLKDGRRKAIVRKTIKKKNVICSEYPYQKRRPCWFHCWTTNRIQKEDKIIDQLLAVCEFQDGHVERINFDHIYFVEDWEL